MQFTGSTSALALAAALLMVPDAASAQSAEAAAETSGPTVGDILVTAQRREANLQDTSAAISAFSAESLEQARILSFEDLANRSTSLSFTALSPLDQEFNVRGITNTRLDSPSADQSIGIFVDDVYVGRSGLFNFDLYDIERVEVIRGPQGVLLGRNVAGGAISIITAAPQDEPSGAFSFGYGNYNEVLARGHVTGAIGNGVAGRLSFQTRHRDGFNKDILHGRDLDDVRSIQFRGQLLFRPDGSDFQARLIFDYTNDKSNGFHSVAIDGPNPATQGPWSAARDRIGVIRGRPLGIRESLPEHPKYKGDANESPQQLNREAWGLNLKMEKGLGTVANLQSITGFRSGNAFNLYDQTGIGPDNGFGVISPTLFSFPVNEDEEIDQFSQEIRVVSEKNDLGIDWIVGGYFQRDKVKKYDRFWAEVPLPALVTLSGESHWDNEATNTSWALFAQLGYRFSEQFRLVGGLRYTRDTKSGTVTGIAVEGGDKFNPTDLVALTPLSSTFREGDSFTANYRNAWGQFTPQATLEYSASDDLFFYATFSRGYKGGGFEDTPANAAAAMLSYDPETVTNYELGAKLDLFERRVRLNLAAFHMKYKNLQVTQTSAACLCNITDNAADAEITGFEAELQIAITRQFQLFGGLTVLDTKYLEFTDSLGNDNSGNFLQRTPKYQFNIGGDISFDIGDMADALRINAGYTHRGKMFWAPDNLQTEDPYGTFDARISFTPNEGRWTASVWGKNIGNTLYRTNIIAFFGDEVSRLGAPRTWGAELSVKF
jgi:iron complex outermembrane receptor protein